MESTENNQIKVLIDTNIILDVLLVRDDFFAASNKILNLCHENKIHGYIACHSIPTLWYILRKSGTEEMRRALISALLVYFDVPEMNKDLIRNALSRTDFKDFEDCLQDESAIKVNADYIVTRNKCDFEKSKIPAYYPEELIKILG